MSDLPYAENEFDYIICNAVLHFTNSAEEFKKMDLELESTFKEHLKTVNVDGLRFMSTLSFWEGVIIQKFE